MLSKNVLPGQLVLYHGRLVTLNHKRKDGKWNYSHIGEVKSGKFNFFSYPREMIAIADDEEVIVIKVGE